MGFEREIESLLSKMTLDEKIKCCHSAAKFSTAPVERLDIPELTMSDGPHGVREEISPDSWDAVGGDFDYATYLPTGTALAATWSRECADLFGSVLGAEARDRGKDVILGPGINMVRNPLCGRNFEYYGEDPFQVGELAAKSINAIQQQGTAACAKHYALNSQELNRLGVDARCGERTLREIYLPAFETAVKKGKVMTIMSAYNKYDGTQCCHNDVLQNEILKKEWGFDGVVMSDWSGVSDTRQAALGGMDIEMGTDRPGGHDNDYLGKAFRDAVAAGEIDLAVLDDKVRRYLRLMFKLGKLGDGKAARPSGSRNTPAHRDAARRIAAEAITLLKNDTHLLPLAPEKLKKLLIVGDNATRVHHLGGHSSAVKTRYEVTPLEGITNYLKGKGVEIVHFRGYPDEAAGEDIPTSMMGLADAGAGTRGWVCTIFHDRRRSATIATRILEKAEFDPARDLPEQLAGKDYFGVISGVFIPDKTGPWTFCLEGASQSRLFGNDESWIEVCKSESAVNSTSTVELIAGKEYRLNLDFHEFHDMPDYPTHLTCRFGDNTQSGESDATRQLLAAAAGADTVLFFGGQNHSFDCEGADRKDMKLHNGQNELIEAIAKVNSKLAVILLGGSPVEMPWLDAVPSVVQVWYAGQEGGNAVADVLFGTVNPSGKLPFTFPVRYEDSPCGTNHDYHADVCYYREGVLIGYRWFDAKAIKPLFPFGFGLSYTTFAIASPRVEAQSGNSLRVSVEVANTGDRSGMEVVQLYVAPPKITDVVRPPKELKGFGKIELAPGERRRVEFELDYRSFAYFHPVRRQWMVAPGKYRLLFGNSSQEIAAALECDPVEA